MPRVDDGSDEVIRRSRFVPEQIGAMNAAFWGAALIPSIVSATFTQQEQTDPEQRWDWPLFVDEVQLFVKAERAEDAERMWTRTCLMGVGLVGAHQGLNQLGEKLGGIVLNVIGGMCLTSGVCDDTRDLVNADDQFLVSCHPADVRPECSRPEARATHPSLTATLL